MISVGLQQKFAVTRKMVLMNWTFMDGPKVINRKPQQNQQLTATNLIPGSGVGNTPRGNRVLTGPI